MLDVIVSRLTHEAEDVLGLELRALDAVPLPSFAAGSHVDLHLPNGLCRQYSLTNDPAERERYCLGVGLSPNSRGGSRHVHISVKVGDVLRISEPRCLFSLAPDAAEHIFIAGGIGITPILSMIRHCEAHARPWRLLYCVRSRSRAAFLWELAASYARVQLHIDEEREGAFPDLRAFLHDIPAGSHVYCCGPGPLMDSVGAAAAEYRFPPNHVHFERFTAVGPAIDAGGERAFTVTLKRLGRGFAVPPGASILETLEANGVGMPFGCREGLCRSCEVPVISGTPDHRDCVLSTDERASNTSMMICVSRALSDELVLDA
jgi:tetrachlorobenzoquinone reductase